MGSKLEVPICTCHHPLDAHDALKLFCILFGCSCTGFTDSGRTQKVER
jgi:hypothetical protein